MNAWEQPKIDTEFAQTHRVLMKSELQLRLERQQYEGQQKQSQRMYCILCI